MIIFKPQERGRIINGTKAREDETSKPRWKGHGWTGWVREALDLIQQEGGAALGGLRERLGQLSPQP